MWKESLRTKQTTESVTKSFVTMSTGCSAPVKASNR